MKRNLLLMIAVFAFATLIAKADVTVEEATDAEYMINAGYSQVMAEDIFMLKNRANGKPIEPLYEKSQNVLVKAWRKFYAYLDPAQESVDRIHHDMQLRPAFTDL